MFTPAQIKADIVGVLGLAATLGFNLTSTQSAILLSGTLLYATVVNAVVAFAKREDPKLVASLPAAFGEVKNIADEVLPTILPILEALPGKVAAEVEPVLAKVTPKTAVKTPPKAPAKPAAAKTAAKS